MKPCEESCPKCGGEDIHREFFKKGEIKRYGDGTPPGFKCKGAGYWPVATKDLILHYCRDCKYQWHSEPME